MTNETTTTEADVLNGIDVGAIATETFALGSRRIARAMTELFVAHGKALPEGQTPQEYEDELAESLEGQFQMTFAKYLFTWLAASDPLEALKIFGDLITGDLDDDR